MGHSDLLAHMGCSHRARGRIRACVCAWRIKWILKRWEQRVRKKAMVHYSTVLLAAIAQVLEQNQRPWLRNCTIFVCPTVSKGQQQKPGGINGLYGFAEGQPKDRKQRAGTTGSRCHGDRRCIWDCQQPYFEYENFELGGTRAGKKGEGRMRMAGARWAQSGGAELASRQLSTACLHWAAPQPSHDLPRCSASDAASKNRYRCKRLEASRFQESPRKSDAKKPPTVNGCIWTNAPCPKSTGIDRAGCLCFCIF